MPPFNSKRYVTFYCNIADRLTEINRPPPASRKARPVIPLIAKLSAGKAALTLSQVEAPQGAGNPEGLLARGFAAIKGEAAQSPSAGPETSATQNPTNHT